MGIVNDNDMEIILNGSQEHAIRKILDSRLFCLSVMPEKKPKRYISSFSSSIFVGFMNDFLVRTFAIRDAGDKSKYEDCESYLTIYSKPGIDDEKKRYFNDDLKRKNSEYIPTSFPTVEEMISYLQGKELVLITNYMQYGNMESMKVDDFLEKMLLINENSESTFYSRVEFCEIRIYLNREGEQQSTENRLIPEDIRNIDIGQNIVNMLEKKSRKRFDNEKYFSAEYEACGEETQALYFVTRFHSNELWDADPVNIVNVRISAFVLPGTVLLSESEKLSKEKLTANSVTGEEYMIDSIHFNSDIFYDMAELEKYLGSYFSFFAYD